MIDLGVEHRLEDDLAGFFGREGLNGSLALPKAAGSSSPRSLNSRLKRRVRRGSAMSSASRSLSSLSVSTSTISGVLSLASVAAAHRDVLEGDAFALDRFDEFHEGGRAHDGNGLALIAAEIHAPQAAPERLLGQDVALGRHRHAVRRSR